MDPVRNPYAPGAGQRPPELAGRKKQLDAFDVVLERITRGRPERSVVLTGLRGVGKTVLLNQLRSAAIARGWGTGKIEARPDQELRRPLSSALHMAVRGIAASHRDPERVDEFLGVLKAFALRATADKGMRERWQPGIDVPAKTGRADSGDIEIDLVELLLDASALAGDVGVGIAIFIDEMQDLGAADISALCAACHELSQDTAPLIIVGAGLPHLPAVLSASKSYSERLFSYHRIGRLERAAADLALIAPADREDVEFTPDALDALYAAADGYPYFVQAYGKATWDLAADTPITVEDVRVAAPTAEEELAVGFFGSRYERATPAEREYMRAMAELSVDDGSVPTSAVATELKRKPASLSPARDGLIKKGLIYSAERGTIAFTVPHFGRYLRAQTDEPATV
ncbi:MULTISPECIES: ATP-binding protein [unclassified Rhodococcus (in: high G+C Gram-positive bacteria)]|uniref:ATP-binding protein n=1 Tax=unclassified Rhodococcus (in: high G+C Gram-positive bacteria) TaxID=192944 RepID=UPI000B9B56D6|nr:MULTISPECIES: ATP-binding protein [unclassified Rhodococcus (in: high G+C Gram-positive bacteria)]OZE34556.1 ATPase [Rhodococcus sp. 05-2254-4]OZE46249.1 ATPase [Rhodococcus sp. 05-2254-3]OZE50787.1 ATPase [Rhodococcus sp. 05-2254-2]